MVKASKANDSTTIKLGMHIAENDNQRMSFLDPTGEPVPEWTEPDPPPDPIDVDPKGPTQGN